MNDHTHLDIFSGLGGFAIAAEAAGFRTIGFCESDRRCRSFLKRAWGLEAHADIRTLHGGVYRGTTLLTGGPPCQPASRAGKRGGASDDRWLWPEALRVLAEGQFDSFVFENPLGILDVGVDGILLEMGRLGYETQCFDIPACAVDSPQLRHRIWIVGFMADARRLRGGKDIAERGENRRATIGRAGADRELADSDGAGRAPGTGDGRCEEGSRSESWDSPRGLLPGNMSDPAESGRQRANTKRPPDGCDPECSESIVAHAGFGDGDTRECSESGRRPGSGTRPQVDGLCWSDSVWISCADGRIRRAPDDTFGVVDGLHRSLLGALGNSIVPQVAFQILRAVKMTLETRG